ncbi:MAG: cell envelope integrity protein CreD [Gammaproteobacteria bacterium]|nr:cell envelope integrity protein CreD [Gammaproteobacteria bacterium]
MNKKFAIKIAVIGFLMLVLLIPLSMIEEVVSERSYFRDHASRSIAQSWTGKQKIIGPVLVVPYIQYYKQREWDKNLKVYQERKYSRTKKVYLLPEKLSINGEIITENRKRGLYNVPVYSSDLDIKGIFNNKDIIKLSKKIGNNIKWKKSYLSVIVSDIRGISEQPQLSWNNKQYEFLSGSAFEQQGNGMHAMLNILTSAKEQRYPFSFKVNIKGMESIQFSAVGKSTNVDIKANWPHPSFIGRYLPSTRNISQENFDANWKLSSFSSDMPRLIKNCQKNDCQRFLNNTFGVELINSVDIYHKTERSVKYAILFISLAFITFFLFEIMKNLRLHPMQYLLVGLSLSFFYLLLISLSEHMAFAYAYSIATAANVITLGVYISAILKSWQRSAGFTAMITLLYSMLYAILVSEDNALLMGSLLFFSILSLVMFVTRKIDWYEVTNKLSNQAVLKKEEVKT